MLMEILSYAPSATLLGREKLSKMIARDSIGPSSPNDHTHEEDLK